MRTGSRRIFVALSLLAFAISNLALASADSPSGIRKRCAFDIGSGETKVAAAEIDIRKSPASVTKLLDKVVLIPFIKKMKNGFIPGELIHEAIKKIAELRTECEAVGAEEFSGVATYPFRMAKNGREALAQIANGTKVSLKVITDEQEATIAFRAAAHELKSDGKNLLVWDIGGGSQQMCMSLDGTTNDVSEFIVSSGHPGVESFRRESAKYLKRDPEKSVNPLNHEEMKQAVQLARQLSLSINPKIRERLKRDRIRVIGLGGIHVESISAQAGLELKDGYKVYTLNRVRSAMDRATNMSDDNFRKAYPKNKYPESQATNVALVLGYMEGLRIHEVVPLQVNLAHGLLVDSTFWRQQTK